MMAQCATFCGLTRMVSYQTDFSFFSSVPRVSRNFRTFANRT